MLCCVWLFAIPCGLQHALLTCPSVSPRVCSNSCPLIWWCCLTISSSVTPFSSCPQSFPTSVFSGELALCIRWPKYRSFSINLSMNTQGWSPLGLTGLISCSPRDSKKSSPAPQLKSINSLVLSLPYGPTLTSICDYWKTIHILYLFRRLLSRSLYE